MIGRLPHLLTTTKINERDAIDKYVFILHFTRCSVNYNQLMVFNKKAEGEVGCYYKNPVIMDNAEGKLKHKKWRRIAKKERRRKIRCQSARQREIDEDHRRKTLERSADYLKWVEEQETLKTQREKREKEEHDEQERLWLQTEANAQKEWQELQEKRQKARAEQLRQEEIIRKEFEAKQLIIKQKKEETIRLHEEELKRQEELQAEIDNYIDNGTKTPEALQIITESQPGKNLCPFFTKTAACKYGNSCARNHRRLALGKILIIPGFYNHFSLEKNSAEYDTDISLEFERSETQNDFKEFYRDIVPELESFGRIRTVKVCYNTVIHLRGNLYVEYYTEREAAKALRKLKGRYYAGKQLNCDFANIKSWRAAVCGIVKCPKGKRCNFLHTFRNPGDQYDIQSPPRRVKRMEASNRSETSERRGKPSWEESTRSHKTNWRWSKSPEMNLPPVDPEKSSKSCSRSSSHNRTSRKRRESSSSRSHRYRSPSPERENQQKSSKHRQESNKENGRRHKSSKKTKRHRSRSPSKSKKSKGDREEASVRFRNGYSSPKANNSFKKKTQKIENEWDTTDSD